MDYKDVNDYELIYRIRENDDDAISLMYEKYEPIIINVAKNYYLKYGYTGVELNDLIQEGRIALYKALCCYKEDKEAIFYTYLNICLHRHFVTYYRRLNSNCNRLLTNCYSDDYFLGIGDNSMEPSIYISEREIERLFLKSKYTLDFKDSNIFELRYNGFSHREISELLDISVYSVDARLCKIRKILQGIENKF